MVLLLSFLGHAGLIAAFLDWRFEMAFLAAISGYVLLLFGASLTGALYQAHLVLLYSGLPALLVAAWLLWRKGSGRRSLLLQPPLVLFLIYAVLAYLALSGRRLVSWDEFTHWGLIVKVIAETSALVKHNSIILCQDYPPGTALLMYHMLKGAGNSEGHMLFANSFLYFLPMLAFLRGVTWKRWGEIALVLLIVYTGVWTLSCGYGYLMVDPILALLFGAAFAIYVGEERSVRGILMAALILATVVLVKKIGFFLAIIGGALILTDQLFCRPRKERRLSCIVAALAVFALAVTVNYSWHGYVVKNGLGQTFTQPMTTKDVIHSLSSKANEYQRSVRDNFITSILHWDLTKKVNRTLEPYRGPYTLAVWLALIATLYVVAFLGERDRWGRRRLFVTMAVFFTGLVIYLFGLLVLYMFTFPLHEAPYAASFARYVNIYTFGFLLAGMAAIQTVYGADPVGRAVRITTLGALAIIFLSLAPPSNGSRLLEGAAKARSRRSACEIRLGCGCHPSSHTTRRTHLFHHPEHNR